MKVFFVENKLRTDKLGILYLAAVIKNLGHEVDLCQDSIHNVNTVVDQVNPDVLLFSVETGTHEWYLQKNKEIKLKHPGILSIFGGPHFTFYPQRHIDDVYIDYIVQGPGEDVISDILDGKYSTKIVKGNLLENPDDYPEPYRDIQYKYDEFGKANVKRFMSSRHCPNRCTYCFNHLYQDLYKDQKNCWKARRSPYKMIEEICHVAERWPLSIVYFNDDDLAYDKAWLDEFLKMYSKKIKIEFGGSVRCNNVDFSVLEKMKKAGCYNLHISVESAVPRTQKLLRRGNIKNEQIEKVAADCKQLGIKIRLQNMIGLPVDDPLEDALITYEFNKKIQPDDSWVGILQPYYGTDIWKYCLEHGFISKEDECMNTFDDVNSSSILNIKNKAEINNLHKWWFYALKYNFDLDFLRVILKQNLSAEVANEIQHLRWADTSKNLYKN